MAAKPIKLSKDTATKLIRSVVPMPRKNITGGLAGTEAYIYTARLGDLEFKCENDWYERNGRIKLRIHWFGAGDVACMYFHPKTLEEDFRALEKEREKIRQEEFVTWAQTVGKKKAHRLIDEAVDG